MHGQEIMSCIVSKRCRGLQIQDPKGKSIERVREIRNQIEQKVKDFIGSITKG